MSALYVSPAILLCLALMAITVSTGGSPIASAPADRYVMGLTSHNYQSDFFRRVPKSEWGYMRQPKIELRWEKVEPQKGVFDWSGIDAQVEALKRNGSNDLLILLNLPTPAWARDSAYGKLARFGPPKDPEDWRRLVRQVAARYADVAEYYEVLNEPGWDADSAAMQKYDSYKFGAQVETDYLEMLKSAYEEIHATDPGAMVISGAMNCDVSGVPANGLWLMDLMTDDEHRMQDFCDAFNLHPYYQPGQWGEAYRLTRDLLDSKGIEKEICVTEIGWMHASDNNPMQDGMEVQRSAIGMEGLGSLLSSGCKKIWVYQDLDDPPGTDYEGLYYGLFDYQGKPMPAWYEFRGWCHTLDLLNTLQPSLDIE
jgi:hypothetical protein